LKWNKLLLQLCLDSPALSNQRGINMGRVYMEVAAAPLPLRLLSSVCWKL
jgi:hypothetical protein